MSYEDLLEKLSENTVEESKEAVRLLVKIADTIINDPKNIKVRTLQKSNATISKKILQVKGGELCLKLMGFKENSTSFTFPAEAKLNSLYDAKDALLMWKESLELSDAHTEASSSPPSTSSDSNKRPSIDLSKNDAWSNQPEVPIKTGPLIKPIQLPPLKSLYKTNGFLHRIEVTFHSCLRYENQELQERARKLIPVVSLEKYAQKHLRALQEHVKKNKLEDPDLTVQDMLILALLNWFKEDFFTWVDSPECLNCNGKTHFIEMAKDKKLHIYTDRVELHKCETCHQTTTFPRYNDLNILLETRKGRCGEWANTFTLLCRAMGWDARFVMDETDHVWTEVYSIGQRRWLHCDPCENVCDKPLLYESGWKKKVSYVIAYSGDEVQDVTWRYTSNHKEVLKRRKYCSEQELINALVTLRKNRQENYSKPRKIYLTKRLALELVELMMEKKPNDGETKGRQSGDAAWKLAREEIHEEVVPSSNFVWNINTDEVLNTVSLSYSTVKDSYEFAVDNEIKRKFKSWAVGCFDYNNILRKEEKDWKQVYLARTENDLPGHISWKFNFIGNSKKLDTINMHFGCTTYENGHISVKISSDDVSESMRIGTKLFSSKEFEGRKSITITATLSGGKGDVAWQHAQIFRQPFSSQDDPFCIYFMFN